MRILLLMDSFKGCLTSKEVSAALMAGIKAVARESEIVAFDCADGGEGTVASYVSILGGELESCTVSDPYGRPIEAIYGVCQKGEVIVAEMASASGFQTLRHDKRDLFKASTIGTGELLKQLISQRPKKLILGLGGSATNDGGIGALGALGYGFFDAFGNRLDPLPTSMAYVERVQSPGEPLDLEGCQLILACDVKNPMVGDNGASRIFGPQKGGSSDELKVLDDGMTHFASVLSRSKGWDVAPIVGAGAAGGLGGALMWALPCQMESGAELVLSFEPIVQEIAQCDLIITGEGRFDGQSLMGKLPWQAAKLASQLGKRIWAVVGKIEGDAELVEASGFSRIFEIKAIAIDDEDAIVHADHYLKLIGQTIGEALSDK